MVKTTESSSLYHDLEQKSVTDLLQGINTEDKKVAVKIEALLPKITNCIEAILPNFSNEGRLFYLGSGTSGRLGILDASECPPTFGVPPTKIIGIIAGGDAAIRQAQEGAEDNMKAGWEDLQKFEINSNDFVIGISASGSTPYVIGALHECKKNGIKTGAIVCNLESIIEEISDFPISMDLDPEFLTGSTRMKSGTAQKMILNMISTTLMIKIGRVKGNKMVDMQLSNEKLVDRGTKMIIELFGWNYDFAKNKLMELGSVRAVIESENK